MTQDDVRTALLPLEKLVDARIAEGEEILRISRSGEITPEHAIELTSLCTAGNQAIAEEMRCLTVFIENAAG